MLGRRELAWREAERLFPYRSDKFPPLCDSPRSLLAEALYSRGPSVAEAFEALLEVANRCPSLSGGYLPSDGPTIDPNRFGPELLHALENCWYASRRESAQPALGLRRDSFYRLPKRIEHLADDLERVNGSRYGSPRADFESLLNRARKSGNAGQHPRIDREVEVLREQMVLPKLLRQYAERLRGRIGSRRRDFVLDQEANLLETVESRTGRPHLAEVSVLLEAIYRLDGSMLREREVSEKALADRRARYRASGKTPVGVVSSIFAEFDWSFQPSKTSRKK